MGRHRSTLRELGWGVSNSPNPWKQGSAKRVVRTLDYSQVELDNEPPAAEVLPADAPANSSLREDAKVQQLQQDGRQQLDRIREQFEAQEAESKRKLDRLNGRIAELGEGKRAMWSVLGQYNQPPKPKTAPEAGVAEPAADATAPARKAAASEQEHTAALGHAEAALAQREAALDERAAALDKAQSDVTARAEAAAAAEQALAQRAAALDEREAGLAAREAAVLEQEAASRAQLDEREAEVQRMAAAQKAREHALEAAEAAAAAHARQPADAKQQHATGAEASADVAAAPTEASGAATARLGVEADASSNGRSVAGESKKVADAVAAADSLRSKVRFDAAAPKPQPAAGVAAPAAASSKPPSNKPEAEAGRDIPCDSMAEWVRSENLTASLVQQRTANPDEVFFPLPNQRTCELADIFSAPRRRDRGKGSGEWTPMSTEDPTQRIYAPNAAAGGAHAHHPPKEASAPAALQLLGVDGEYMGEQLALPTLPSGPGAPTKVILLGRSSSCDVTLSRDDQISRRHMQIEARDGKLMARDLGSTYGTRINGKALGAEAAELKPGDVLVLGASSFQLQAK